VKFSYIPVVCSDPGTSSEARECCLGVLDSDDAPTRSVPTIRVLWE